MSKIKAKLVHLVALWIALMVDSGTLHTVVFAPSKETFFVGFFILA